MWARGRPVRIEYAGAFYHITSRGNERREIFLEEGDRRKSLDLLRDYHDRYSILIHAYVLMDNHVHLILETLRGNLLRIMHGINSAYMNHFNRSHERVGHLLQGRYRAILGDKDRYLLPLSRYVHLNPVRVGLVKRPEGYLRSSYRGYVGKEKENWMEYVWLLSQLGERRRRAAWEYRIYMEEGLREEGGNPLKDVYGQMVLGERSLLEGSRAAKRERAYVRGL